MARLILVRLLQALATLLMTSIVVFVLARSSGNPADLVLPQEATPAERTAYIQRMGLDRPLAYQYLVFAVAALQGDFGKSLRTGAPATEIVFDRLGRTLRLATAGLLIALAISVPLGVLAAVNRGSAWDRFSMGFALRHVDDLDVAFDEYQRVLKPGGRILLLEVSRPDSRIMRWVIRTHFQRVLPLMTRLSTRSVPAELLMKYYWDTIDQCVSPATILDVLRRHGFVQVKRRVYCGFLSEYVAVKAARSAESAA